MALTQYTSPEEVRTTLGLTVRELSDAVFELQIHETRLVMDLDQISDTLAADYLTMVRLAAISRTVAQQKLVDLTQLFSAYSVSKNLIGSLALFSPQKITDGKAAVERYVDSYAQIKLAIEANYANIRAKLRSAYSKFGTLNSENSRAYLVVSAGIDPVTGV